MVSGDKLSWCFRQKDGVHVVSPSDELAKSYLDKAEESLKTMQKLENTNTWKIVTAYYTAYLALYALFRKVGIKCEIHDCTIEAIKLFIPERILSQSDYDFLTDLKELRINAQYYIEKTKPSEQKVAETAKKTVDFFTKLSSILHRINTSKMESIRARFEAKGKGI